MDSNITGLSASSTLGGPKFKIHQSIPSGSVKRGPHAIVRSVELNDCIEIQRRCGEGSIPLFDRHDITVNQTINESNDKQINHEHHTSGKTKTNRRSSSRESSSPERYRHRDIKKHSSTSMSRRRKTPERTVRSERPSNNRDHHSYNLKHGSNTKTDKYSRKDKSKTRTPSPNKKKPGEKVPYYRDEQREKDRLKRLYGRSCSRSPPPTSRSSGRKYSPITKRRIESPRRRRSRSKDRYRKYSPHRSSRRDYRTHRSSRSRSRSRTRSPSRRERHKHYSRSSRERDKEHKEDVNNRSTAILPPTPQFILPVAVPADYAAAAYTFPGWTTAPQLAWHPGHHRPPAAAPFPMVPMLPALRPPTHQASYAGLPPALAYPPITSPYRPHIPQRYPPPRHNTNNYHSRPKKPTS
ncbi:female-specific protein transformer-like isoform 1-T4 [Cochliomyia hominivorax]